MRPIPGLRACALAATLVLAACGGEQTNEVAGPDAPSSPPPEQEVVPSCYAAAGIGAPASAPDRAVFVFVDQTTGLDDRLRERIAGQVRRLLRPGTRFTIATFSAFSRGHYPTVRASGTLEPPLTADQRLHLDARKVGGMEQCLREQHAFAAEEAARRVGEATADASASFANSEIMASLKQLSQAVRAQPAGERIVIVVSDLLEHSTATSFYANRDLRPIEAASELERAQSHDLFGDFAGAEVAVVGAGLLSPESGVDTVRDRQKLNALRAFWERWFERSNARLAHYGEPDLVAPIR